MKIIYTYSPLPTFFLQNIDLILRHQSRAEAGLIRVADFRLALSLTANSASIDKGRAPGSVT